MGPEKSTFVLADDAQRTAKSSPSTAPSTTSRASWKRLTDTRENYKRRPTSLTEAL